MINLLALYFFFFNLCGLSFIFKYFFFKSKKIINLDLIYGFYFLLFLAIFSNFFIPLKFIFYPVILAGTISFFFNIRYFKLKFYYYFFIIKGVFFISLANGIAVDSVVYHLQIIQKFNAYPIILGFSNLDSKYGFNNPWQLIMSIFYFDNQKINFIYYFNLIIFSILIYEGLCKKVKKFSSYVFLISSISFLFLYSFLHPSGNGLILTLLGSPDTDFPASILCILSVYIFLKKKNLNCQHLPFFVLLCFFCKISYFFLFIFLINPIYFSRKNLIIISIPLILYISRNLLISGCAIYPLPVSCFSFAWTDVPATIKLNNILTSFARDIDTRSNYMNFDYTLNSFDWLKPWFINYFLKTSIIQITILSSLLAIVSYLIDYKKILNVQIKNVTVFLFFAFSLILWTRALDVRYIFGILISINAFFFTLIYLISKSLYSFNFNFRIFSILIFFLLILKNYQNINYINKSTKDEFANYEYKLIDAANLIYNPLNKCADIYSWCTYESTTKIIINKNLHLIEIIKKNG